MSTLTCQGAGGEVTGFRDLLEIMLQAALGDALEASSFGVIYAKTV